MQSSPLSIVDILNPPYEVWSRRKATLEEIRQIMTDRGYFDDVVRDQRLAIIGTPMEAARHAIEKSGADGEFNSFVENQLLANEAFKAWRQAMPSATPPALSKYQKELSRSDLNAVDAAIAAHGASLPMGQVLYHGGHWPPHLGSSFRADRPLSTTLVPSVALNNAAWGAKAYEADEIHLFALRVESPSIKAFVFRTKGTRLGHEHEVLLPSGIQLELRSKIVVRRDYPVGKYDHPDKVVDAVLIEVAIL